MQETIQEITEIQNELTQLQERFAFLKNKLDSLTEHARKMKVCVHCGKTFTSVRNDAILCSNACRKKRERLMKKIPSH